MSFSVSGGSPIVWNVSCAFYVGNVVAILEADIPPAPTNVVASSPSAINNLGRVTFVVTAYDGYASEPTGDTEIKGVAYKYKRTDKKGTWSEPQTNAQTSSPITYTITGLDKTGATANDPATYRVKVAQYNNNNGDASQYYWKYAKTSSGATDITIT